MENKNMRNVSPNFEQVKGASSNAGRALGELLRRDPDGAGRWIAEFLHGLQAQVELAATATATPAPGPAARESTPAPGPASSGHGRGQAEADRFMAGLLSRVVESEGLTGADAREVFVPTERVNGWWCEIFGRYIHSKTLRMKIRAHQAAGRLGEIEWCHTRRGNGYFISWRALKRATTNAESGVVAGGGG